MSDIKELSDFLHTISPFRNDALLHNIATGVIAKYNVNIDNAESLGHQILQSITWHTSNDYTVKKSNTAVTKESKSSVIIDDGVVNVNPSLMFPAISHSTQGI